MAQWQWLKKMWINLHMGFFSPLLAILEGMLMYSDATPIKQGVLGDCWLLSTCAALAKKEELLFRVIDPKQVENLIREKPGDEIKRPKIYIKNSIGI